MDANKAKDDAKNGMAPDESLPAAVAAEGKLTTATAQTDADAAKAALDAAVAVPADKDITKAGLWKYGDVDRDGKIDSTDARMVLQTEVKLITPNAGQSAAAEVAGDTKIDSTDARLVLQFEVKLITRFPIQDKV